jgi:MFS family permease
VDTVPEQKLQPEVRKGLRLSVIEGSFAQVTGSLTSGAILIALALFWGANEFQLGMLAALPFIAQLVQIPLSILLEKRQGYKSVTVSSAAVGRLMWLFAIAALFLGEFSGALRSPWFLLGVAALSFLGASANALGWLSWMTALVPERIRGEYFGKRNMILGATAILVTLFAGWLLDWFKIHWGEKNPSGFILLLSYGVACGMVSIYLLRKIPFPGLQTSPVQVEPRDFLKLPLRDLNFRRFITFSAFWSGSVQIVAPFFAVYMLVDLNMSYALYALLGVVNTVADALSTPLWGKIADRHGTKPILTLCTIFAALIPILWITTGLGFQVVLLIALFQAVAGLFWSGINLNTNLMLMKLAPEGNRSVYFASYAAGVGAITAIAPIIGGILATLLKPASFHLGRFHVSHFFMLFALSGILRLVVRRSLFKVAEPEEKSMYTMIRVISRNRVLNVTRGFEPLLHYVLTAVPRIADYIERRKNRGENQENEKPPPVDS